MGLFSIFHAAQSTTFRSNGQELVVTLEKIANAEPMQVIADSVPIGAGTVIELLGLDVALFKMRFSVFSHELGNISEVEHSLRALVAGFPLQVTFDEKILPNPHAEKDGTFVLTPIGHISCPFVNGTDHGHTFGEIALFLQGLPISRIAASIGRSTTIIQLDSTKFSARVPDRQRLYGHDQQMLKIRAAVTELRTQHLRDQKEILASKEFAAKYSLDCIRLNVPELLNDIAWISTKLLSKVDCISSDEEDVYTSPGHREQAIHRSEFESGLYTV